MKTIKIHLGALLTLVFFTSSLHAATILTGESVRISDPIEGNVYAGAGQIYIDAVVNGDVTAGAGELRVTDTIRRDLSVGAGRVRIDGVIGDDLRCGGGEIDLFGQVLGDVLVGGGQLEVGRDAVIHGDLVVAGGQVRIYGKVLGSVIIAGGEVLFEGEAEKDAEIRGGTVTLNGIFRGPSKLAASTLILGSRAEFYQEVRYWQKSGETDFGNRLREGATAVYDQTLKQDMEGMEKGWFARGFGAFFLFWLLSGVLLVTLLSLAFGRFFRRTAEDLPAQWLNRFGMGILYLFGVPAAIVVLFITVIGIPIGLFALFFYIFSLVFAPALTAVVGANVWEHYRSLSWSRGQRILVAIGLLIVLRLLMMIPAVGWLLLLIAVAIALGSIVKAATTRSAGV